MSERFTEVRAGTAGALQLRGRVRRELAIAEFRAFYREQLREANAALAATDEEIETVTYTGCYAQRNREPVT